jgi:hypothetical protein
MEQLIWIVQKAIIKNEAMFESNFDALRSNSMKGYPAGLQKIIENMKKGSSMSGPIEVDLKKPAVDQLWNTVNGILSFGTIIMKLFLKLFGYEVGNGLSPFAVNIETPGYVCIKSDQVCEQSILNLFYCVFIFHPQGFK